MGALRKAVCLLLLAGLALGCRAGMYGSLKTSGELMAGYRGGALDETYHYYYCGRSGLPYAVVGIDPDYTFDARFWFPIKTMEDAYVKIDHLSDLEPYHYRMFARDIFSPDGRLIGTYFSYYMSTPVIVDNEKKTIAVYVPYKPESRLTFAP